MTFDPSMIDLNEPTKLTDEERRERRRLASRLNMESRRQAVTRLIESHRDEFDEYYRKANLRLRNESRYKIE